MKIAVLCENSPSSPEFEAEHGLSFYVETSTRRFLFDFGATSVFLRNAERLGVDVSTVDAAFLSHGHRDHGGGLAAFLEKNTQAPVYAAEKALQSYYSLRPSGEYVDIGVRVAPELDARIVRTPTAGTLALDDETLLFSDAAPDPPEYRSEGNATLFERFDAPERTVDSSRFTRLSDTEPRVQTIGPVENTQNDDFSQRVNNVQVNENALSADSAENSEVARAASLARKVKTARTPDKSQNASFFQATELVQSGCLKDGSAFFYRPDRFLHEQHLIATTETGRKILFVGCAHRGIVSAMTRATEILGAAPDVAIGGFHLSIPSRGVPIPEETLDAIVERLRVWPTRYLTGHCSGRVAFERARRALGDRIAYFSAGSRWEF